MFDEVLFRDRSGRVNRWTLVSAIFIVEMLDERSACARGVERQDTMSDMTSSRLESATRSID